MDIEDIEQTKPNKPNFGLVVGLFCVTLLTVLVLALFFLKFDGKHVTFRHRASQPNSSITVAPSTTVVA